MSGDLPEKFKKTILGSFGEEGRRWLDRLPEIVGEVERRWSIRAQEPFPNLSYHYVAPCVRSDESEAVIKIGFPGEAVNIINEAKMLRLLGGRCAVELLDFDDGRFAFLLEKLTPGENLKTVCRRNDREAVEAAIEVMRVFWRKPPENHEFPMLSDWFGPLFEAEKSAFPAAAIKKARKYFEELTDPGRKFLLHGDFHHENILSAARAPFLAIDPKGVVGEIGYDISNFMANHARHLEKRPDRAERLDFALRKFAEAFELESVDLRKWVFSRAVLSAFWTFEENGPGWKDELDFAETWRI